MSFYFINDLLCGNIYKIAFGSISPKIIIFLLNKMIHPDRIEFMTNRYIWEHTRLTYPSEFENTFVTLSWNFIQNILIFSCLVIRFTHVLNFLEKMYYPQKPREVTYLRFLIFGEDPDKDNLSHLFGLCWNFCNTY